MSVTPKNLAVHCRGVVKEFGEGSARVQALRGVDLDVRLGEMTLLVGPSGCGKTTLLSIIAGLLEPTRGSVNVLGYELEQLSSRKKVHFRGENIGFVFQQYNLLPALTAVENVAVPNIIGGMSRRKALAIASDMIDRVGLGPRMHAMSTELSGGQQQRVAIARALSRHPKLLVCDEPTSALDAENGRLIMKLLRSIAVEADRAVIIVTHDSRVYDFGDTIASMEDGLIESVKTNQAKVDFAEIGV